MINDNISIQLVTENQLDDLHFISRQTFTEAFSHLNNPDDMDTYLSDHLTMDTLFKEMSAPESEFYFAMEDNKPIAYFKINTGDAQTELKQANGFEIERIYVLQEHQGKKLGHGIIDYCIKLARQKHKTYVWLGVWERNVNAIRFYENNGFVAFDEHRFQLGNDLQTDVMMRLDLL